LVIINLSLLEINGNEMKLNIIIECETIQDEMGKFIADAINEKIQRQ